MKNQQKDTKKGKKQKKMTFMEEIEQLYGPDTGVDDISGTISWLKKNGYSGLASFISNE
jgi:hypothetical protein